MINRDSKKTYVGVTRGQFIFSHFVSPFTCIPTQKPSVKVIELKTSSFVSYGKKNQVTQFKLFISSSLFMSCVMKSEFEEDVLLLTVVRIYSRLPITRTFKGNRKKFEISGVRVIGSSKKIAESKVKNRGKKQFLLHSEHFNHI